MTVAKYFQQYGAIATLRKLGYNDLAEKLEQRQRLQQQALDEEGPDVPFNQRRLAPEIKALDPYCNEADSIIYYRRKEKIEGE